MKSLLIILLLLLIPSTVHAAIVRRTPRLARTPHPVHRSTPLPTVIPSPTIVAAPTPNPQSYYATFYYPWYGTPQIDGQWRLWADYGHTPPANYFSNYMPEYGLYSSNDDAVILKQIADMQYAHINVAISSWHGPSSAKRGGWYEDDSFRKIVTDIMHRPTNPYPDLKWTLYYEDEGFGDPPLSQLVSDLNYVKTNYATDSAYLKINDKPVIFVYDDSEVGKNPQAYIDRWRQAASQTGFYVSLKAFPGYTNYQGLDSWHEYQVTVRSQNLSPWSWFVSPGYFRSGDPSPLLARDLNAYTQAIQTMVSQPVTWKLVETWNEWGEGSSVEGSQEFGRDYLDVLHNLMENMK